MRTRPKKPTASTTAGALEKRNAATASHHCEALPRLSAMVSRSRHSSSRWVKKPGRFITWLTCRSSASRRGPPARRSTSRTPAPTTRSRGAAPARRSGPSSTIFPARMTPAWVARRSAISSTWVVSSSVTPRRDSSESSSRMTPAASTSMPSKGSSSSTSSGAWISAAAMARRRRMPLEYSATRLPPLRRQLGEPEQLLAARGRLVTAQPVHAAAEDEVLPAGEPLEEGELLGHHAQAALHLQGLLERVTPQDAQRAPVGPVGSRHQRDGGRLAGAVGTEERIEGAPGDGHVEAVDGGEGPEPLEEPSGFDR